ncbi:MAG: protein kinase [Planctomycetes bacterium]|nr:protein kinase [Planctomycetota bacterium]
MAERILVADDSRELRTVLSSQLSKLGFDVKVAVDGQDALRCALDFQPQLIIMDIMMPKLDGLNATRRMREDPRLKHTPIILLSSLGEEGDVMAGIEAGADEYLVKPFRQGELAAKVRILLRKLAGQKKKLDETTVHGLEEKPREKDTSVRRFKETGQIVSKEFAGFTILDKLGQGGTATVYRAMEPIHLKPVALKVISPFAAVREGFLKRLRRSNEISIKLVHTAIVRTYTMGEYQGVHFVVQELVDGAPLDQRLEKSPGHINEAEARRYLAQVASALDYLHERKLIHRDVKPGNIYISSKDEAKLGDFGLSRLSEDTAQTAEGYLLGTPHYISPEQANGSKDIDIRSDLYALGACFYHLLAGEAVFPGDNMQQVVLQHLTKEPPSIKAKAPTVSDGFAAILAKLLHKERDQRYQTPAELLKDLAALPAL